MNEGTKTIRERIEQYKGIVDAIRRRFHEIPEGGTVEDAIYDSPDADEYHRAIRKLRTYQRLLSRQEAK